VFLADQRIEASGAIFTGENLVGHRQRIGAAGCEIQTAFYLTDAARTVFKLGVIPAHGQPIEDSL
jgi:hypothetical protein